MFPHPSQLRWHRKDVLVVRRHGHVCTQAIEPVRVRVYCTIMTAADNAPASGVTARHRHAADQIRICFRSVSVSRPVWSSQTRTALSCPVKRHPHRRTRLNCNNTRPLQVRVDSLADAHQAVLVAAGGTGA